MIRLHTASAGFQRSYFHAFSYIHPSGSLRSKNTFMPGKAQDMNIHLLHIDRVYPRRLRSVHNKKKPMLFRNLSDSLDIYHISCKIRSMCTDNSFRVLTDLVFYLFIRNISFTVAFHNAQFAPTLFHLIQWTQDGIMFQHCRDRMILRIQNPFNRNIERFCRITCKHNLCWIFRTKEICE